MNSILKYEIKKINNKSNWLSSLIFLLTIIVILIPHTGTDVVKNDGTFQSGIKSWGILEEQGKSYDGKLDLSHMKKVRNMYQEGVEKAFIEKKVRHHRDLGLLLEFPSSPLFWEMNFPYSPSLPPRHDMNLEDYQLEAYYANWIKKAKDILKVEYPQLNASQLEAIDRQLKSIDTPFYYEFNWGYWRLSYYMEMTLYIFFIYLAFLLSSICARNEIQGVNQIDISTKNGKFILFNNKIKAGVIVSTLAYLAYIIFLISYTGIFNSLHGWNASIQFLEGVYIFNLRIGQYFLLKVLLGWVITIVITYIMVFFSALIKNGVLTLIILVLLFYLINKYMNSTDPMIKSVMYFMPQNFMNEFLGIGRIYIIENMIIPYAVVGVALSFLYIIIIRQVAKIVMYNYYMN